MGISIQEFQLAMETFNAIRLDDRIGPRYNINVPCFDVNGVKFLHSGSYYVVLRGNNVSKEFIIRAMEALGEKYPGGDNFWWDEIHSIRGVLTLASMIECRYSKELIAHLTNETYKKLLNSSIIQSNEHFHYYFSKMDELYKLINEFDNIVNPFGNNDLKLKNPSEYLDNIKVNLSSSEKYTYLSLFNNVSSTKFNINKEGWNYRTDGFNDEEKGADSGYTSMIHYFSNAQDNKEADEFIYLRHTTGDGFCSRPGDIELIISLKSGLVWKSYYNKESTLVTDEQIKIIKKYLKFSIDRAKRTIIDHMIDTKVSV